MATINKTSLSGFNLISIVVVVLGILFALWLGLTIGRGQDFRLIITLGVIVISAYTFALRYHALSICIFLSFLDFSMRPVGFGIAPTEQVYLMLVYGIIMELWLKRQPINSPYKALSSYELFQVFTSILLFYGIAHFVYNWLDPYEVNSFGFNGALKTYLQTIFPCVFIGLYLRHSHGLKVNNKLTNVFLWSALLALFLSVCLRLYIVLKSGANVRIDDGEMSAWDALSTGQTIINIPLINASESPYTLRVYGPYAALMGTTFFFSVRKEVSKFASFFLMALGLFGSLISGGRASIIFAGIFMFIAAVRRGKTALCIVVTGIILFFIAIINLAPSSAIEQLPFYIQRSIVNLRFVSDMEVGGSIEDSSRTRKVLFDYAIDKWKSDSRIFWFGRSAGTLDSGDVQNFVLGNQEGEKETAIKRLATHNGISDTLICFGLVGLVLQGLVYLLLLIFLWKWQRMRSSDSCSRDWIFIAFCALAFYIFYTCIGGSWMWQICVLFVIVAAQVTRAEEEAVVSSIEVTDNIVKNTRLQLGHGKFGGRSSRQV